MRCVILILTLLAIAGCKNLQPTVWLSSTDGTLASGIARPADVKPPDDRRPVTLGPGICTEDYGNTIDMNNHSASAASIVYRTLFEPEFLH